MMEEYTLYMVPGSRHSREADEALKQANLPYKKVLLNNRDLLSAAPFDLGIQKAPALCVSGKWYQGLKNIKEFILMNNR